MTWIGIYFVTTSFNQAAFFALSTMPKEIKLLIGILYVFSGTLLQFFGTRSLLLRQRLRRNQKRSPDQPWRFDFPWNGQFTRDKADHHAIVFAMAALLIATLLAPFIWWALSGQDDAMTVRIFVGPLVLILFFVFGAGAFFAFRFAKFGFTTLTFARFPFHPGESLEVGLAPNRFLRFDASLRFIEELRCEPAGVASQSVRSVVYETKQTIDPDPTTDNVQIRFQLPENPQWTNHLRDDKVIRYWELVVEASQTGISFRTSFLVPVYRRSGLTHSTNRLFARAKIRPSDAAYSNTIGRKMMLASMTFTAILVALRPGLVSDGIDDLERSWRRIGIMRSLVPITDSTSNPIALHAEKTSDVWSLSQFEIARLDRNATGQREVLLDSRRYYSMFQTKMDELSAFLIVSESDIWVGTKHGEILHFYDGRWRQVLDRQRSGLGHVYQIVRHAADVFVGAPGLWRWSDAAQALQLVKGIPEGSVRAMVSENESSLWLAVDGQAGILKNGLFTELWNAKLPQLGMINGIAIARNGDVAFACDGGIVTLNKADNHVRRDLNGIAVMRLRYDDAQRLWATTRQRGYRVLQNGIWLVLDDSSGLAANDVTDILFASSRAWLAIYSEGIAVASIPNLLRAVTR